MLSEYFLNLEGKKLMPRQEGARFIVFEGIDGSGKSTAAKLLYGHLKERGLPALLTKEPSLESEAGRKIREILTGKIKVSTSERQWLFSEDRAHHVETVIVPALKEGKIVLSDRYFFSTFAFGMATGVELEWLIELNKNFPMPDLVYLFAVSPKVGLSRIDRRGEGAELHDKLDILGGAAEAYTLLAKRFPNFHVIDGEKPIGEVFEAVRKIYEEELE